MSGRIYISSRRDTPFNLAMEEELMARLQPQGWFLFLWAGEPAVVIGKHQNPWAECRLAEMERDGVRLARRVSGGGAVYHDPGNLNYSFIVPRDHYDREIIQRIALAAIHRLGIPATIGERHILEVDGRKFSGNAFCYRRQAVLHHGTVLIDADLERLHRYLAESERIETSRAIASVPSPVINLTSIRPTLTVAETIQAFAAAAEDHFQTPGILPEDPAMLLTPDLQLKIEQHTTWRWLYGNTPLFNVNWQLALPGGHAQLALDINRGIVTSANLSGTPPELAVKTAELLSGCAFIPFHMAQRLRENAGGLAAIDDLAKCLLSRASTTLT